MSMNVLSVVVNHHPAISYSSISKLKSTSNGLLEGIIIVSSTDEARFVCFITYCNVADSGVEEKLRLVVH